MRTIISILLCLIFNMAAGQELNNKQLLDSAKTLFKLYSNIESAENRSNPQKIVPILEQILNTEPNNVEALYYLGYCYSRINAEDANDIINMDLPLLYKTSTQFETIIDLKNKYDKEIIILDPYSKIASEWASMALSYLYQNKGDSVLWSFKEGKKRGGFTDFILEINRQILDACSPNSILISSGDNLSFTLMYLQNVEKYRTDISLVDISLLNTTWYPRYLSQNNIVKFNDSIEVIDSISYRYWSDSTIHINDFKWTIKPSYYEHYLLRGDLILLSLLQGNAMERDLYFTIGADDENKLSLIKYLKPRILVEQLAPKDPKQLPFKEYNDRIKDILQVASIINPNSTDDYIILDLFRDDLLRKAYKLLNNGDTINAKKLITLLDQYANPKTYPYSSEHLQQLDTYVHEKLNY